MANPLMGANGSAGPSPSLSAALPSQGDSGGEASPSMIPPSLADAHSQAKAKFDAIDKAKNLADKFRSGLDSLVKMGDAATADDVLEEMSKLVAAGADPKEMIALVAGNPAGGVAPMPESGEALASWLKQNDAKLQQLETQLAPIHAAATHQMGVTALQAIMGHHLESVMKGGGQAQGQASPQGQVSAQPQASAPPSTLQ